MSKTRDTIRFGRVTASRYWLGIEREDDAMLYQTLPLWRRVLFWWGVLQAARVIYPWAGVCAVATVAVMLLCAVVFGWGPF